MSKVLHSLEMMQKVDDFLKPLQGLGAKALQGFRALTLLPATENDFHFAYELKKIAYKEYVEQTWGWDEAFQINFHKESFSTDNTIIISLKNKPIGTVDVKEEDERIFISGLYLLPEYQSKGIGSSILGDIETRAKTTGKRLELEVLKVNVKAQEFYKRLGYIMLEGDENKFVMYKSFDLILGPSP